MPNSILSGVLSVALPFLTLKTAMSSAFAVPPADPQAARVNDALKKAAQYLVSIQDDKGGIHANASAKVTMTSLAILAFAALGHQPADPSPEGKAMKRALEYVLRPEHQDERGYFGTADRSKMYGHGITTLMLAEMVGMGTDDRMDAIIRERLKKGIDLILSAQRMPKNDHNRGGWRYEPSSTDSDMSVTCWQTMALRAAKNAGMEVPKESIDLAVRYIKSLAEPGNTKAGHLGGFGYSGRGREISTTAEGLLALQVCGDYDSPEVKMASERLFQNGLKGEDRWFYYTAYYYAQGMYQRGDKYAAEGRRVINEALLPKQRPDHSWNADRGEESQGGRVYATALSILALSVKNHYLPIYQR